MVDGYQKLKEIYENRGSNYYSPIQILIPYIQKYLPEKALVLDLGCGDGRILSELKAERKTGVDFCQSRIIKAKEGGYQCVCMEVDEYLLICQEIYNVVIMMEVLEHLIDDLYILRQIPRVCPNGLLIASVPIQMPDDTHLRVFDSTSDVIKRYNINEFEVHNPHLMFVKHISNGSYLCPI